MHVFVVDTNRQALPPVHPGLARRLLSTGKAAVLRRFPFTLIMKTAVEQPVGESLRLKIAPGARTTGIAVVNDVTGTVVFAAEIEHRGNAIKMALEGRRSLRRNRRSRKTRYRQARFQNRRRREGWLPPSQESRLANVLTWVERLRRVAQIGAVSLTHLKFDPAAMKMQYEQGSIEGYEVQGYLLEKWGRECAYCGKKDVPLTIDHIVPVSRGGRGNISNLTLACEACNKGKGSRLLEEFLAKRPEVRKKILATAKAPLKDVGQLNSTRWALFERLKALDLEFEVGTGGLMKYNRSQRHLPKAHWIDAVCTGKSTPEHLVLTHVRPLQIKATGHGNRQMCQTDKYGFPKQHRQRHKGYFGFRTGDMVRARIKRGKYTGVYTGRITVRATGAFKLRPVGSKLDIPCSYKYCEAVQRTDGYSYK